VSRVPCSSDLAVVDLALWIAGDLGSDLVLVGSRPETRGVEPRDPFAADKMAMPHRRGSPTCATDLCRACCPSAIPDHRAGFGAGRLRRLS